MPDGSSLLTEAPATVAQGGNPAPQLNAAQQALADAQEANEIPEWVPEKFWDRAAKAPKTEELGRSYKNLEKLLGTEKAPIPTNWDDPEQVERWYKAGGRPDKEEDYEFKRPDSLPDDLPYDEDMEKSYRRWARENGLNKRQAAAFYDAFVKQRIEQHASWRSAQKEAKSAAEHALRRELGARYDGEMLAVRGLLKENADADFHQMLDETGLGNDPRMVRFLRRLTALRTGETKTKGAPAPESTPADAKLAIAKFREEYKTALWDKSHPDHDLRVQQLTNMGRLAYGEE